MASVHESLYFNPMITNGVVHANIFGIKDWVTPYKIAVLYLLYEMSTTNPLGLLDRRPLNKLILPLQQVGIIFKGPCMEILCAYGYTARIGCVQGPDLSLEKFLKIVEECCARMADVVKHRYASFPNEL